MKWLLLVGSIIVAVFLVEVGLRLFTEPYPSKESLLEGLVRFDDTLGWINNPNLEFEFFDHTVRTNSEGFRDDEYAEERILILGDSFGWGWGVPEDSGFAKLLDWDTYNMSVTGYGTDQELLLYLRTNHPHDLVVLQLYSNDIWYNVITDVLYYKRKPVFTWVDSLLIFNAPKPLKLYQKTHMWLVEHSQTFGLLWKATHRTFAPPIVPQDQYRDGLYRRTLVLLSWLQRTVEANGAKLIVFTFAGNDWFDSFGAYGSFVQQCNEIGIATVPLDCEELYKDGLWIDGKHWNKRGHRIVADRINGVLHEVGASYGN